MRGMATAKKESPRLDPDASLGEVIEVVNEFAAESVERQRGGRPEPLDEPFPSASLVYANEAYDDLVERLDAPRNPNERLRRTMLGPDR